MKTRREFFKLFGKAALVGGVVAAVPATALALVPKLDIKELAKEVLYYPLKEIPYITSGYAKSEMQLLGPEAYGDTYTVTTTTSTTLYDDDGVTPVQTWTTVEPQNAMLRNRLKNEWQNAVQYYDGVR